MPIGRAQGDKSIVSSTAFIEDTINPVIQRHGVYNPNDVHLPTSQSGDFFMRPKRGHPSAFVFEFYEPAFRAADEPNLAVLDSRLDCDVMAPVIRTLEKRKSLYHAKRTAVGTSLGQAGDPFEAQCLRARYHVPLFPATTRERQATLTSLSSQRLFHMRRILPKAAIPADVRSSRNAVSQRVSC